MPFSYCVSDEMDLILVRAVGVVSPQAIHDCIVEYFEDPSFRPGMDVLFTVGDSFRVEVEGEDAEPVVLAQTNVLNEFADLVSRARRGRSYRVACVGGGMRAKAFFLAGMMLVNKRAEKQTFDAIEPALKWLGSSPARVDHARQLSD